MTLVHSLLLLSALVLAVIAAITARWAFPLTRHPPVADLGWLAVAFWTLILAALLLVTHLTL